MRAEVYGPDSLFVTQYTCNAVLLRMRERNQFNFYIPNPSGLHFYLVGVASKSIIVDAAAGGSHGFIQIGGTGSIKG